ncbi:hypothetical protein AVEN_139809-1 [Araneus ventricosus]|uniref:Uncharacterized protein n=1 Tax=Araneus ventricosus TaxID=182803 RepID=A0A4Y2KCA0_ARAVE|nr:hypothetical protein AVEN_139809-1 [Araneus ventricosus]
MDENYIDEESIKSFGGLPKRYWDTFNGSIELFKNALKHPLEAVVCLFHLTLEDDLTSFTSEKCFYMVLFVGYTYIYAQKYPRHLQIFNILDLLSKWVN